MHEQPNEPEAEAHAFVVLRIAEQTVRIADPSMRALFVRVRRLAANHVPVLVSGESGVGKEIVARALHQFAPWHEGPFVPVNCGALPPGLVESEFFGHERGAFSGAAAAKLGLFESAAGGTLFLDEIGELPIELQTRLLRFLDDHRIRRVGATSARSLNVRIVAATNRDLRAQVTIGQFREDLFYRLRGTVVRVPPLRQRRADIPIIARDLLDAARARDGLDSITVSAPAMLALVRCSWPGNVRELKHAMDLLASMVDSKEVGLEHLPEEVCADAGVVVGRDLAIHERPPGSQHVHSESQRFTPIYEEVRSLVRSRMIEALIATGWIVSQAARLLRMPRRTFIVNMQKFGINRPQP